MDARMESNDACPIPIQLKSEWIRQKKGDWVSRGQLLTCVDKFGKIGARDRNLSKAPGRSDPTVTCEPYLSACKYNVVLMYPLFYPQHNMPKASTYGPYGPSHSHSFLYYKKDLNKRLSIQSLSFLERKTFTFSSRFRNRGNCWSQLLAEAFNYDKLHQVWILYLYVDSQ